MYILQELLDRVSARKPIRVGLIGAGKFGSMFLSQIPTSPAISVVAIVDLDPDGARAACRHVGWDADSVFATRFTNTIDDLLHMEGDPVEVIIEATGDPAGGLHHAARAIDNGIHVIMVTVEADVLAGAFLAERARKAGVVYSMAYGDQPALTCELVDWARACGFAVTAAGKGTKYLPSYHVSTPDTVWDHYGLTAEQAREAGMNPHMFNSFLDGTKSAIEMAAIANATGLNPPPDGLVFPPAGVGDLAETLKPSSEGGTLHRKGQVEVVSSLNRDGSPVTGDLRWGVYVVMEAPNDYAAACFRQYGMNTDATGRYSAMYKPFHLIGLELNISILSAVLLNKPTGATRAFNGDVVAIAKRGLKTGDMLDGEGGYTVWGKLYPANTSLALGGLPIGLANKVKLTAPVSAGQPVRWRDVALDETDEAVIMRKACEAHVISS